MKFLGHEPQIFDKYCTKIRKLETAMRKKMCLRGLINSSGQSIPFFGYALALYYGGTLVANDEVHFKNIFR